MRLKFATITTVSNPGLPGRLLFFLTYAHHNALTGGNDFYEWYPATCALTYFDR